MLQAELFIKAVNAYKPWCKSGMDFVDFTHLYEALDEAVMNYARACNISRNDACTQVYVDVAIERTSK